MIDFVLFFLVATGPLWLSVVIVVLSLLVAWLARKLIGWT